MLSTVFRTTQFKRDFKSLLKKHYDPKKLQGAVEALMAQDKPLLAPSTVITRCPATGGDTANYTSKVIGCSSIASSAMNSSWC